MTHTGGHLQNELKPFKNKVITYSLSDYFDGEFFGGKRVVYLPG
jgi:hypothetical protein